MTSSGTIIRYESNVYTHLVMHFPHQLCGIKGVVIVDNPSGLSKITHLVFADRNPSKARTFKALIAYNVTGNIVSRNWVFACKKAGSIVPSESYRFSFPTDMPNWFDLHQTISNGVIVREAGGLFGNLNIYIHPETVNDNTLVLSEIKALIKSGGGTVVRLSHMKKHSRSCQQSHHCS